MLNACRAFIVLQPFFYFFIHVIYMASHTQIKTVRDRAVLIFLSPVYAVLQYTKLLAAFPSIHQWYMAKAGDNYLQLLTLENTFKVQVFLEFFLETLPQMIV
jgi:hypothetical protein